MGPAMLPRLVEVRGAGNVPVTAESGRSEGTVRECVSDAAAARGAWLEPGPLEAPASGRPGTPRGGETPRTPCGHARDA